MLISGGLAADQGLVAAMRESAMGQKMTVDVRSHPQSILAGALGAAFSWLTPRYRTRATPHRNRS